MGYSVLNSKLIIASDGVNPEVTLPARYRSIGISRNDAVIMNINTSHTCTIPRSSRIQEDLVVSDGVYQYRIIEFKEIFGRYRLELERL